MNVTNIRESDWDKDGTIVKVSNVSFDDGSEAPGYDLPPGLETGKPLPNGWEVATAKSGKKYIKVPKAAGGGGGGTPAFRNTREGFLLEQESIHRSVALQAAVALYDGGTGDILDVQAAAPKFYAWLREAPATTAPAGSDSAVSARPEPQPSRDEGADTEQAGVLPAEGGASVCSHPSDKVVLTSPAGSPLPRGYWRCEACGLIGRDAK